MKTNVSTYRTTALWHFPHRLCVLFSCSLFTGWGSPRNGLMLACFTPCPTTNSSKLTWLNANDNTACCLVIYGNNTEQISRGSSSRSPHYALSMSQTVTVVLYWTHPWWWFAGIHFFAVYMGQDIPVNPCCFIISMIKCLFCFVFLKLLWSRIVLHVSRLGI